jgi:urease accessory protein UreF
VTSLAERAGAVVPKPRVARVGVRSLVAVAIENAVEGCVNETFGAAVAVVQSMTASDMRVRAAMRRIARDELRHAELAWRVARWVEGRLGEREIERMARARTAAVVALLRATSREVSRELVEELGLPAAPVAGAVAAGLAVRLWAGCSVR